MAHTDKRFLEVEMIYEEGDIRGVLDIVMQVFFRTRMGVRYFTFKSFWGGLLVVLAVRFFFIVGKDFSLGYPFHALDIVLLLYVLLGFWHLIQHSRLESKGQGVHSYFMGYSRLFFVGKGVFWLLNLLISLPFRLFKANPPQFGVKSPFYFTYTIVEPLITLGLGAFFYLYLKATVTALLFAIVAVILFWTAINKVSSARQIYVDRTDGQIFSQSVKADMIKANDKQMEAQGMRVKAPPLPYHSPLPSVSKTPVIRPNREVINVADILKKSKLKKTDKRDSTE